MTFGRFPVSTGLWKPSTCVLPPGWLQGGLMGSKKWKRLGKYYFSSDFRRDVWEFSCFEGFAEVAFNLRSAAWLAVRWADRIQKVERYGKC